MPTDEERREVAERLREFTTHTDEKEIDDADCLLAEMVMGSEFCPHKCGECFEKVCKRLADLIDPDLGSEEVPTSQAPQFDREALLALADKIFADTEDDVRSTILVPAYVAGEILREVADRIREACGEVVE